MNYQGSPRTVRFQITASNVGAALYPGAYLDSVGVNNNVWLASGVIVGLTVTLRATTVPTDAVRVYDFCSAVNGRPLSDVRTYLLGGGENIAARYNGLNRATGAPFAAPVFEAFNAVDAVDGRTAFVPANARMVYEDDVGFINHYQTLIDMPVPCPHGMVIHIGNTTGVGVSTVTVDYIPWMLGAQRKKQSERVAMTDLLVQ